MPVTKFSKIIWGDGLTVTDDGAGQITVAGGGGSGPPGPTGPAGPTGATGAPGAPGVGVPAGGSDGQVLTKTSSADYATDWETPSGGGGSVAHLDDIGDVAAPSPADEQVLAWDAGGGDWEPKTAVLQSMIDAKGDLIAGSSDDHAGRLAAGSNGQILTADSAQTLGVKWAGGAVPAGGTIGQVLKKASSADYDAFWQTPAAAGGYEFYEQTTAPSGAALGAIWVDTDG